MGTSKPKAPRPGVGRRIEEANAATTVIKMRIKDETRTLQLGSITMRDRAVIRNELEGASVESFVAAIGTAFGMDVLFVLWFLAGRQGDPTLKFADAEAEFNAVAWTLTMDDIDAETVDADGSPEA